MNCQYCGKTFDSDDDIWEYRDCHGSKSWFCSREHASADIAQNMDNIAEMADAERTLRQVDDDEVMDAVKEERLDQKLTEWRDK